MEIISFVIGLLTGVLVTIVAVFISFVGHQCDHSRCSGGYRSYHG